MATKGFKCLFELCYIKQNRTYMAYKSKMFGAFYNPELQTGLWQVQGWIQWIILASAFVLQGDVTSGIFPSFLMLEQFSESWPVQVSIVSEHFRIVQALSIISALRTKWSQRQAIQNQCSAPRRKLGFKKNLIGKYIRADFSPILLVCLNPHKRQDCVF